MGRLGTSQDASFTMSGEWFSFLAGLCNTFSLLVNKVPLHCRVADKMHSVCEKLSFSQNLHTQRPVFLNTLMYKFELAPVTTLQ